MCPDEEVIQSEVAESNKILVQTDLKEIVGDDENAEEEEDEEDSLPESMQKQKDETNNNRDEIDQENNPIENDDGKATDLKNDASEVLGSSNSDIVLNKKYLESKVVEEETEAGIIQAVAIKVVVDDDQIKVELEEEEETVQDNELSDNTNLNQPQQQTDVELKLSDHEEEEDIETSDNKSEVSASGKLPSNKEETAETGSDDKVEEASGENFNNIITDEEIPMEQKNSLENLTENVAKVKLEEEEWPECDQANIDNQISDAKELEGEKESAAAEMVMEEQEESYPQDLNPFGSDNEMKKSSTNPFGSESDDEVEEPAGAEKPETEIKQRTEFPPPKPPRLSLNPFGSDFEDGSDDEEIKKKARKKRPAPLPPSAVSKVAPTTPQPAPRISLRPPPRYHILNFELTVIFT